ncbi:CopG family antitoxin [Acidithiobacillus sp.]
MRIPAALLKDIKARARAKGIPYSRYVRMLLESKVENTARKGVKR